MAAANLSPQAYLCAQCLLLLLFSPGEGRQGRESLGMAACGDVTPVRPLQRQPEGDSTRRQTLCRVGVSHVCSWHSWLGCGVGTA